LELRHLRYFVAVAEKLNFTEAARSVHIAQPSLSQQIQDLEKHIGVSLMERNNRLVKLTPAGKAFLSYAKRILQDAEDAKQHAIKVDRGEIGECRIGFLFPAVRKGLAGVIAEYKNIYPKVRLTLGHYNPADQINMLENGELDIAFTWTFNNKMHPDLHQTAVYEDTLLAVLHPAHPMANQLTIKLAQLANQPIIMFSREVAPAFYDLVIGFCGTTHNNMSFQHRQPYLMDTIVLMVESGLGIGIVPGAVKHLRQTDCVFLPFATKPPPIKLLMVQHKSSLSNPVVSGFTQLVLDNKASFQT
jgi:DNA-binding transcriptional LysR family regulator